MDSFWVEVTFEWYEGAIVFRVFIFIFCLETTVLENNYIRTTSIAVTVKFVSASTWSQLCSKFFLNNYKTPWQWYMKDTLQLKILPTSTNVGVKPALRHLTYCNFCHNLFTFLCLKDVPPLINFSNVFQSRHSYSNPPTPLPLPPLFSIKH